MKKILFLLLVFLSCCLASAPTYILIAIPSAVTNVEAFKAAMRSAYHKHIEGHHFVSIWLDEEPLLTWTDAYSHGQDILYAISRLELNILSEEEVRACTHQQPFGPILETIKSAAENAPMTNIYFVVDNARDSSSASFSGDVQVYPIGIGRCVRGADLKRVSGPCNAVFGCHVPFSYIHSQTYGGLLKKTTTQERSVGQHHEKRDAITKSTDPVSAGELTVMIVLIIVSVVLALWCLLYSCYFTRARETSPEPYQRIPVRVRARFRI